VEEVSKGDVSVGSVISIELSGDMEKFYDTIRVIKGPSFGVRFTLLCPFMYLAHYDLVTTAPGRAFLASVGLDPELIRISIGAEDYASIEAVFAEALDFCLL
jgi:cystathionine gamma-synthase